MRKNFKGWKINFESDIKKQRKEIAFEMDRLDRLSESTGLSVDDWNRLQWCKL